MKTISGSWYRRIRVAVLSLGLIAPVGAISGNAGSSNAAFLGIPTDGRGVALTDTMVAVSGGVDSLRWNPAGLASLPTKEAAFTHVQYYQNVALENAGLALPFQDSGLAANVLYLSAGSLDGRDTLGQPTGNFKYYDLAGTIGYGRKIMTRDQGVEVSIGAGLKLVQEVIANQQYQNPALDLGTTIVPWEDVRFGAAVRNLSSGSANFPREIVGAGAYTWYHVFTTAAAVNYLKDAPVRLSASGEWFVPELDSVLRIGYRTRDSLNDSVDSKLRGLRSAGLAGLTGGVGIDYHAPQWPTVKFLLDYGIAPFGALGIAHTVTLKMQW